MNQILSNLGELSSADNLEALTKPAAMNKLAELEASIKQDLEHLSYPKRPWVRAKTTESGENIFDCLIIGGGQSGLGLAFGLMREQVRNILVIDENPEGQEGPWPTFARMPNLRTPKNLTGLEYNNPHLSFYYFYIHKYSQQEYNNLSFIPTHIWADYLSWYRRVLNINIYNQTRANLIRFDNKQNCFGISYQSPSHEGILWAKTVVLANGIDGCGQWQVPKNISDNLSPEHYAHTRENINFASLKGKKIAVLGAGASAFDNAIKALESGAQSVHLFSRRKNLPHINPYRWAEFAGFLKHHADLGDQERWAFISQIIRMGQLPPKNTYERARSFSNFYLELGQTWEQLGLERANILIDTGTKKFSFDFLIIGTGFITDLKLRPELSALSEQIACWQDRYSPPPDLANQDLSRHPYLGPSFQFSEKEPGQAPFLSKIFCYNFGCLPSMGLGGASISGLKYSLPKIVSGITAELYKSDSAYYLQELKDFSEPEYELF